MTNELPSVKTELVDHARSMLRSKVKPKVVYEMLVENGATPEFAKSVIEGSIENEHVEGYETQTSPSDDRKSALYTMLAGLGLLAIGAIITWSSFNSAEPGGKYLVATGLIAMGILQFFRGLWQLIFG